jgi:hypothetical protein
VLHFSIAIFPAEIVKATIGATAFIAIAAASEHAGRIVFSSI